MESGKFAKWVLAASAVLLGATPAGAQEGLEPLDQASAESDEISASIRFIFLGGDDGNDGKWSDDFENGGGLEVSYSHLWSTSNQTAFGLYVGMSLDGFGGESESDFDPILGPFTIDLDDLGMFRLLGGVRGRQSFGKGYFEGRLGIGLASYSDADVEVTALGTTITDSAIESSTSYAFEAGLRFGVNVTPSVGLAMGLDYEVNGPPDVNTALFDDAERQENIVLSLGADFGF